MKERKYLERIAFIIGATVFACFAFWSLFGLIGQFQSESGLSLVPQISQLVLFTAGGLFCASRAKKYSVAPSSSLPSKPKESDLLLHIIIFLPPIILLTFGSTEGALKTYVITFMLLALFIGLSLLTYVFRGTAILTSLKIEEHKTGVVSARSSLTQGAGLAAIGWLLIIPFSGLLKWFSESGERWNDGGNFILVLLTFPPAFFGVALLGSAVIGSFVRSQK